jgi:hypothetical protein
MIGLYVLIGALALLVTILLFGFVGCADSVEISPGSETYFDKVMSEPDLIAYWRLGEGLENFIDAKNEVEGSPNGFYDNLLPAESPEFPDFLHHSPAHPGELSVGSEGLLGDQQTCMKVDGGGVQVPFNDDLNHTPFTFEAWVFPKGNYDPRFFYCLVESTGPPGLDQKKTGWGLYLGPDVPSNPSGHFWQVWMGDGDQFKRVAIAKPDFPIDSDGNVISPLRLTYLALTFNDDQNLQLWLYYPDTGQGLEILQALEILNPPIIFRRNDQSDDGQGEFFIGTGSNLFPDLGPPSQRLYPFKGKIQEVALYKSDLSENDGVLNVLLPHIMSTPKL